MTVHNTGEPIESTLARLHAALPLETDAAQQAVLHHEAALLEEARGDQAAAEREHSAALDVHPDFREPLEALIRLLRGNPAAEHLAKLLETLAEVATSPEQTARALWELASYRQDLQNDYAAALDCLMSAVETDPKDVTCWLELELAAARMGDAHLQIRSLEARAELTQHATWQGLLSVELARACAEQGDMERATSVLDAVVAGESSARFVSRLTLEAIAAKLDDGELWAHALEGQAELVAQSVDDPDFGDKAGVPRFLRRAEVAAEAWLRASELRRRAGDAWGAVAALSGAAERLPSSALVARLRMAAADASGDHAAALEIAREQLAAGAAGRWGAALWLRVGQAADEAGDAKAALDAFGKALELDASCVPALAMRLDVLASGSDHAALATVVEQSAGGYASDGAKARAQLVAAQLWACRLGDSDKAKQALAGAAAAGIPADHLARLARAFAAVGHDSAWYSEATGQLLRVSAHASERAALWLEIGRSKLEAGDVGAALEAFGMLGQASDEAPAEPGATWLGRCLAAYAVGLDGGAASHHRRHEPVAALAAVEPSPDLGRGLVVVAALLASRTGQADEAIAMLERELEREPRDVVIGLFLADLHRRAGRPKNAAATLAKVAAASGDGDLGAALHLESAFLLWAAGEQKEAVAGFELALEHAPTSARQALSWALRCVDADDPEARRRAIDLGEEAGGDAANAALERFGLGVAARDGGTAPDAALEQLEELAPGGDLAVAVWLGRLLWSAAGGPATEAVQAALAGLAELDGAARVLVHGERFRIARFEERDGAAAVRAAQAWAENDPGVASATEWLAAALAADDRAAEIAARRALAAHLSGAAQAAVEASAATAALVDQPALPQPLHSRDSAAGRLMNLELASPGGDPRRRTAALRGIGSVLGPAAEELGRLLSGWADLARGAYADAQATFKRVVDERPDDLAAWEGYREASDKLGDHLAAGIANARLGSLCRDNPRAATFWETAGLTLLENTKAHEDAEIAFERALERDPSRSVAFDKLFRRVRSRNEDDRLMQLIDGRLRVTTEERELTKMYWERARVLRRKGDQDGALKCLKDVTMLEPDHVGALALAGEIHITRGEFAEAAPLLGRLSGLMEAPDQQRLVSGVAAADLYEKKLNAPERALEVLVGLHRNNLSTGPVRERLARIAARVGNWDEATTILEKLMEERDSSQGRAEAARLAMAIYRDKLNEPAKAEAAVARLLKEIPDDAEAIHLVLGGKLPAKLRSKAAGTALRTLIDKLGTAPFDIERVQLLAEIAQAEGQRDLQRAALGCLVALGRDTRQARDLLAELGARAAHEPQMVLDATAIDEIADPEDSGPYAVLFRELAPVISEALGPSLDTEGVGRKQRIDSAGDPLRAEASRWMAALGYGAGFQLYVGGREEHAVKGVPGDEPALIVGSGIKAPLEAPARTAIAREVFALRRGTSVVLRFDDHTIASIAIAASIDAGVAVPEPPYAVYPEVSRAIRKAMNRKVRKLIVEPCQQLKSAGQDAHRWAAAARRSIDRMALIASADASIVIDDVVGPPDSPARRAMASNERAKRILAFALLPGCLELRSKFGMGIA